MAEQLERLMHLVDGATDDDYFIVREGETDDAVLADATQRQIASALGAIVLLLLRRDQEASDEWDRY